MSGQKLILVPENEWINPHDKQHVITNIKKPIENALYDSTVMFL